MRTSTAGNISSLQLNKSFRGVFRTMKSFLFHFSRGILGVLCIISLFERSALAFTFVAPQNRIERKTIVTLPPTKKIERMGPFCQTNGQSTEEFKISSQIARLNAVAAKLRAEAAELEVS